MIHLYGARTGNCLRVSVALEEAGIPYRATRIDLRRGEHLGRPYRALNPDGKVPTIVDRADDGAQMVMTQSNAILFHLADIAPGRLLPVTGAARALALQRYFFVLTDVIGPNHAAFRLQRMGVAAGMEQLEVFSAEMLSQADRMLDASQHLAGEEFGLADIAALTTLPSVLTPTSLEALPRLSSWFRRVSERRSVIDGLKVFDLPSGE